MLLALMLCSTLAGKVPPSKFLGFSLLSYGYLYFLIANVAFIVIWLCFSSKWFLLSLLGIVARFGFLPLYFQVGGTETIKDESLKPDMIKVLTFNAHHFKGSRDELKATKTRIDSNMIEFMHIIDSENPDVIAIQEYDGKGKTVNLTERLIQSGYIFQSFDNKKAPKSEVIFSKARILQCSQVSDPTKIHATMLWNNDTVNFYCLHLGSYCLDESDQKQIQDISHGNLDNQTGRSTLQKFSSTIKKHELEWDTLKPHFEHHIRNAIVVGDFNDPPASFFYQQCRKLFTDSYCEVGQGFSTTYHGTFTRQRAATFPAFRIDLVLHSQDIKALSYKRIKSDISDHYPIIVTLQLDN